MMPSAARCQTCGHLNDEQVRRLTEQTEAVRASHHWKRALAVVGAVGVSVAFWPLAVLALTLLGTEVAGQVALVALMIAWSLSTTRCLHQAWVHHEQGKLRHQIRKALPTTTITASDPAYSFKTFVTENANTKN